MSEASNGAPAIIKLEGVGKTFYRGKEPLEVLKALNLRSRRARSRR